MLSRMMEAMRLSNGGKSPLSGVCAAASGHSTSQISHIIISMGARSAGILLLYPLTIYPGWLNDGLDGITVWKLDMGGRNRSIGRSAGLLRAAGTMSENNSSGAAGLCADCEYSKIIRSDRGGAFYQCLRSFTDP